MIRYEKIRYEKIRHDSLFDKKNDDFEEKSCSLFKIFYIKLLTIETSGQRNELKRWKRFDNTFLNQV